MNCHLVKCADQVQISTFHNCSNINVLKEDKVFILQVLLSSIQEASKSPLILHRLTVCMTSNWTKWSTWVKSGLSVHAVSTLVPRDPCE